MSAGLARYIVTSWRLGDLVRLVDLMRLLDLTRLVDLMRLFDLVRLVDLLKLADLFAAQTVYNFFSFSFLKNSVINR